MAKETKKHSPGFELTGWAKKNFRFIGELHSVGCHNEAHHLKYNPVSADNLDKMLKAIENPGLANLIVEWPETNQEGSPSSNNGNSSSHGEPSSETPLVTSTAA